MRQSTDGVRALSMDWSALSLVGYSCGARVRVSITEGRDLEMEQEKPLIQKVREQLDAIEKDIITLAKSTHVGTFDQRRHYFEVSMSYLIWLQFDAKNLEPTELIKDYHHDNFLALYKFSTDPGFHPSSAWDHLKELKTPRDDQFRSTQEVMKNRNLHEKLIEIGETERLWMALDDLQSALTELKRRFGLI